MRPFLLPALALLALPGCGSMPAEPPPPSAPPDYQPLSGPSGLANGEDERTPVTRQATNEPDHGPSILGSSGSFSEGWDEFQPGAQPSDWVDVRQDGYDYPWLYPGQWSIASIGGFHAFEQTEEQAQPALSFRRYSGKAFQTPAGELPIRYRADVWLAAFGSPSYPPIGDQGVPLYYLDPTHYLEVLLKPHAFEAWQCAGGEPDHGAGWKKLFSQPLDTAAGEQRQLGMIVDASAGTAQFLLDGQLVATASSPIVRPITHYLALRSAGNTVAYYEVRARSMPQ
ncbi:MAG: hypothetical protein KGR26_06975 [Cyanobacteria bacterium REEB65]|nr:hypothetical protein [Cyanobacteria bacterium REEB65]